MPYNGETRTETIERQTNAGIEIVKVVFVWVASNLAWEYVREDVLVIFD